MTKPVVVSLGRRFATMAALLAGIAMLVIAGASWWLINQEHTASLRGLLKKDAELQATSVSSHLHAIAGRMSELANSALIANTLIDSSGKERYLIPYLNGIQRIDDIAVAILFTDFEGREIARNGNGSFSEPELSWLREKLPAGQAAARVQLGANGERGEELMVVEFIVFARSNSVEGALLYRIKLDDLRLQKGAWLVRGKEAEQLLHSQTAIAAAVDVPPIYKHFNFAVLISADPSARSVDWQTHGVFFILTVGMVVMVIMLGLHFGKRLTRDLRVLEFFARDVAEKGFGTGRAEVADSLEVASLAQSMNAMLEHLKQQHDRLNESEMMSRSITEGMVEGVITTTTENIVLEANAAALQLFGYEKSELIGRDTSELVPERHRLQYKDTTAALAAQPEAFRIPGREVRCLRKDGSEFNASMSFADAQVGGRRLFTGMILDITERKRVQDEILRLNANLEERVQQRTGELEEKAQQLTLTSQYKSEFLSSMSHELRTPLNSLLILAQLLAENHEHNLSERQVEYAKTIQGAGKDLLALISDILDLSKIESGSVTLELDDVSLANVGEQLERSFRHVAESRGLGFGVELTPSLPPSLYTDAQRLQQVLKNLLSNAFKFTSKGQVSVRIAAVESGWSVAHDGLNRAGAVIGFYVTDSGIGLAADKQQIIFEAFQQADTGTARKYGGTGLGLSISRELARLLGGELHLVASQPGQGSTFALYLPLRVPESGGPHDAGDGRL